MSLGVRAFVDEGPLPASPDALPSNMRYAEPCVRGHADSSGRGVRYTNEKGTCVGCERENRAKYRGREAPTARMDEIVALALARERRRAEEAARRRTPKRRGLRTAANSPGKVYTPPTARRDTGVVCARRGCSVVLTRIAVEHGSPFCSRVCAGLLTKHEREPYAGPDEASDEALQGVEHATA